MAVSGGGAIAELVDALAGAHAARRARGDATPTAAVFSGAIGAGKTTTIRIVAQHLETRGHRVGLVPERLPAHLFAKYLRDPHAYAWVFQCAMAHLRAYDAYDALERGDVDFLLFERYIGEDWVFFEANVRSGTIDAAVRGEYTAITAAPERYFRERCALLVDVHTTFALASERMCRRNREGEQDAYVDNPYFRTVFDMREQWVAEQAAVWGDRVIRFDNTPHSPLHVSACELAPA
jgi:deoxyadenosine/deoxycytidine kinase